MAGLLLVLSFRPVMPLMKLTSHLLTWRDNVSLTLLSRVVLGTDKFSSLPNFQATSMPNSDYVRTFFVFSCFDRASIDPLLCLVVGTTFLYSSGDYGVAGNFGLCIDKTTGAGTVPAEQGVTGVTFNPSFPGQSSLIIS